jgi:hypothetical protein
MRDEPLDIGAAVTHASPMPSPRVRAVLNLVSEMTDDERTELRDELDGTTEQWESEWSDELQRRMAQIERGEVKLLTREEFFAASADRRR